MENKCLIGCLLPSVKREFRNNFSMICIRNRHVRLLCKQYLIVVLRKSFDAAINCGANELLIFHNVMAFHSTRKASSWPNLIGSNLWFLDSHKRSICKAPWINKTNRSHSWRKSSGFDLIHRHDCFSFQFLAARFAGALSNTVTQFRDQRNRKPNEREMRKKRKMFDPFADASNWKCM